MVGATGIERVIPTMSTKTPLLLIGRRLKCTKCNEREAHCWPEPYGI